MNPLNYLKGIVAAVGASVFPPIFTWLVAYIPGSPPASAQEAVVILLTAICTGGAVTLASNQNQANLTVGQVVVPATSVKPEATASIVAVHKA